MGYHLSRHKMTIYAKNFGGMGPRSDFFPKSNSGFRFFTQTQQLMCYIALLS